MWSQNSRFSLATSPSPLQFHSLLDSQCISMNPNYETGVQRPYTIDRSLTLDRQGSRSSGRKIAVSFANLVFRKEGMRVNVTLRDTT